jgi:hypothetical protein
VKATLVTTRDATTAKQLVAARLVIGAMTWVAPTVAPRLTGKVYGLSEVGPQLAYVGRLFAIRDVAFGIGLFASRGKARRLWWQLGILCDAVDVAAAAVAARTGQLPRGSAAFFIGSPLLGTAAAIDVLRAYGAQGKEIA